MKRLYVAISLILISFLICCVSNTKIKKSTLEMKNKLESISEMIASGENEKALSELENSEKLWKKTETLFSYIIDADKIEELNIDFSMISAHLKDKNAEHALEKLRECEFMLEEIADDEKLDIKNIM